MNIRGSKTHCSQRTSIADGEEVEKPLPGNRSSLCLQRLKIYSDVQKSSFRPRQKDSDMLPIAPTIMTVPA